MQCVKPVLLKSQAHEGAPQGLLVACGKCLMCRIARRREWAMRLTHELDYHENAIFLTLTYDDDNLPWKIKTQLTEDEKNTDIPTLYLSDYPTLKKTDLQLFIKRLRQNLKRAKDERIIKYFACGEYGDLTQRPHYHAIIFGLNPQCSIDRDYIIQAWKYCDWNVKQIIDNAFGFVEADSITYVSKYINKEYSGKKSEEEYKNKNRESIFSLKSQGIGKQFALDNKKYLYRQELTFKGVPVTIPRYYIELLDLPQEERLQKSYENEREKIKALTGYDMTLSELKNKDYSKYKEYCKKQCDSARQRLRNTSATIELFSNKKI